MKPVISVVTGTYNRCSYLVEMMESVIETAPPYLLIEFCICDGGSTDGTLEWLKGEAKEKFNIKLLEHGQLMGAIKAFNDASKMATGDYLLIANDDIVFKRKSVGAGLGFMLSRPDVGAGCFYQDRAGKELHVEQLHVKNEKGEDSFSPYLQVGLIPRWLWLHCGGWGDFGAWTYGGDCYVSAKVLEAGYKIEAIPETKINDRTPMDALRKNNNDHNEGGSDGQHYYKAYPEGVKINFTPQLPNPLIAQKKVLYVPIIEKGHDIQKQQKKGLREALKRLGIVWEVDYQYGNQSIAEAAKVWKPDLTITQIHSIDAIAQEDIKEMRLNTNGPMINWNGDVWQETQKDPRYLEMLQVFDLQTGVNNTLESIFKEKGINYLYWQNSFEKTVLPEENENPAPEIDVIFLGNNYSEYREKLAKEIKKTASNVKIYGRGYPEGIATGESLYDFKKTGKLYRISKIAVADNQYYDAEGFFSDRTFMILASGGAMMMHQRVRKMEELGGFKDGIHYVAWDTTEDLKEKIQYYFEHEDERKKIADAGTEECRKNHNFEKRVEQLQELIKKIPNPAFNISTNIICKNEEKRIAKIIDQVMQFSSEVIVVDTGSEDKTKGILAEFLAVYPDKLKVYNTKWEDDFSKARNFCLKHSTKNWIFWVDCDDNIPPYTIEKLKILKDWDLRKYGFNMQQAKAFQFLCKDSSNGQAVFQTRLFKNISRVKWNLRIHENVDISLDELGIEPIGLMRMEILHQGNISVSDKMEKQKRNIRILSKTDNSIGKHYHLAAASASAGFWAEAILSYQTILKYYSEQLNDELKNYIFFAMGFAYFKLGMHRDTRECYTKSNQSDAYYFLAELEGFGNRPELLMRFLDTPAPSNLPTFKYMLLKKAKIHLREWHEKQLKNLIPMLESAS